MLTVLLRKILLTLGIMLGAVLVVHTLIYLIPGDPAIMIAGDYANPEDIAAIRNELALDDPFFMRYIQYLKRLSVLDMGRSVYTGAPVTTILCERFPATLALAVIAMISPALQVSRSGLYRRYRKAGPQITLFSGVPLFLYRPPYS